ncbi:MAG: hypothetical protein HC846_07895 [Blastocatellia bacterium]|nr:hypothetical protein [Blastocatellia bacterium]
MKKTVFLLSVVCLFALSAFAQTPNFAGEWNLDKAKSKLSEQQAASIESQTITIEQTDKEIKATTATKRNAPPAGGQGGGMGGGRGMGGGDGASIYSLDGKEVVTERETQFGKIPTKTTAKMEDGKLKVTAVTTINTPNGEMTTTTKSTWELSADGKTLTVKRESETPRGTQSSESVYTKKS